MMALKKAVRSKTSAGAKKSSRSTKQKRVMETIGGGAMVMALVGVLAVAIVIAAHESADGPDVIKAEGVRPDPAPAQLLPRKASPLRSVSETVPAAAATTGADEADASDSDAVASPAKKPSPITVAGCLERTDNAFRLKDTTGADAPKSRSWKSGFLKKSSASIDLVESGNGLRLRDQVGKRVSVTGTLTDRQMRVQSVRRVAQSCS
jgi:hypothetical protein